MDQGLGQYAKAFEESKQRSWNGEASWLRQRRDESMKFFLEKGFPTTKDEAWRFTDVKTMRDAAMVFDHPPALLPPEQEEALQKTYGGSRVVFLNGRYCENLSAVPAEIEVSDLNKALRETPDIGQYCIGFGGRDRRNVFEALNTAFMGEGAFIRIPDGKVLTAPLRLLFFAVSQAETAIFQPRVIVVAGRQSQGMLLEHYKGFGSKRYFSNIVAEFFLEEGASLQHARIQEEAETAFHVAATGLSQKKGSRFSSWNVSTGASFMRNDFQVILTEEEGSCTLNGLSLSDREQLLDQHTFIDHQKPSGISRQFFKGLLAGKSHGVFSGKVCVRPGAFKTDAVQTNKNLLLSENAKVDTQPQLEIDADDVKCSHGAAVGQLQEDALFYFKSRGIGERDAGRMLARGFVQEVIETGGPNPFQKELEEAVARKLELQFCGR